MCKNYYHAHSWILLEYGDKDFSVMIGHGDRGWKRSSKILMVDKVHDELHCITENSVYVVRPTGVRQTIWMPSSVVYDHNPVVYDDEQAVLKLLSLRSSHDDDQY